MVKYIVKRLILIIPIIFGISIILFTIMNLTPGEPARLILGPYASQSDVETFNQAMGIVGCRVVRLDCHDELIDYYKAHGFRLITTNDDRSLNQMMAFVIPKHRDEGIVSEVAPASS